MELLAVIAVISMLTAFSGPALSALTGSGTVNKAIFDVSGTLQAARAHAMAHHTYVRIAFAETTSVPGRLVILSLSSSDGTLSAGSTDAPAASDMADSARWQTIAKPLTLENLGIFNTINGASAGDAVPSDSPLGFTRTVAGAALSFKWIIQFTPSGEASVLKTVSEVSAPDRYIKIAMDRPSPSSASSPMSAVSPAQQKQFVLRVSGVNGSVAILRKGEGL